jgi:hypothetical protein
MAEWRHDGTAAWVTLRPLKLLLAERNLLRVRTKPDSGSQARPQGQHETIRTMFTANGIASQQGTLPNLDQPGCQHSCIRSQDRLSFPKDPPICFDLPVSLALPKGTWCKERERQRLPRDCKISNHPTAATQVISGMAWCLPIPLPRLISAVIVLPPPPYPSESHRPAAHHPNQVHKNRLGSSTETSQGTGLLHPARLSRCINTTAARYPGYLVGIGSIQPESRT